jgi:hypothetical protein
MKPRIIKDDGGNRHVSHEINVSEPFQFYRISLQTFEQLYGDSALSDRELDFLACVLLNFEQGRRKLYDKESVKLFSDVAGFKNVQVVRVRTGDERIKKWLVKQGREFKMPIYAENLIKSDKTSFKLAIKLEKK